MYMHARVCACARACVRTHRAIQKSPHNGKMVSLFKKHALYGHYYIDITCGSVSPLTTNYIWCYVRKCIYNAFFYFVVLPGTAWPSNAPASKNYVGWGMETSEATQRVHGDQSHDLETANLSDGARRYHILMYGDFWITLCMRVYTCALVIVMFRR